MKTHQTEDYSIFKKHESNRPIDRGNLMRIKNSIESRNLLEFRPILVDKGMHVIDGQHRLEAAKMLGVKVFYQIDDKAKDQDILLLNLNQKSWLIDDYLNFYVSAGNENYKKVAEFKKYHQVDIRRALQVLSPAGGDTYRKFRTGTFIFPEDAEASEAAQLLCMLDEIKQIIRMNTPSGSKICLRSKFNDSLITLLKHKDLDFTRLKNSVQLHSTRIHECPDTASYSIMLKEIYNWKLHNKIE